MEGKGRVIVSEVALPLSGSERLAFFTTASRALLRSSSLLNVFLEQNRGFFVFAPPVGESLPVRIQRRGLLSEQEAVNCYAQIAATLLSFSQQQPTVVHGLIQSDHIFRVGSNWALTHGSLLAAGGATRLLPSLEETPGATQSTPDSDLFALSAVIYSAVTGSVPPLHREEQQRQLTHASLSATFAAVLLKGVHPQSEARYHHPSEIMRALGRKSDRTLEEEQRLRRRDTIRQRVQQATHPSGSLPQGPRRP
jgi:hypothetical protein